MCCSLGVSAQQGATGSHLPVPGLMPRALTALTTEHFLIMTPIPGLRHAEIAILILIEYRSNRLWTAKIAVHAALLRRRAGL